MADTTVPDTVSTVTVATRSAHPNPSVSTGRSTLASYGATLAANHTITAQENEPTYPLTIHLIDPSVLFKLFYTIIFQICVTINRELNFPDLSQNAQLLGLQALAGSVAYDALEATYAVLYNKARRYDPSVVRGDPIPSITYTQFPIFISTLINAFGPIQRADLPSRRTHVPYLNHASMLRRQPATYQSYHSARFNEKFSKTRFTAAAIEHQGVQANAWWTFWAIPVSDTNLADNSTDPVSRHKTYRVFSPIKYEELEPYFKVALIYAQAPLVSPGIGFYSVTNWYSNEELTPRSNTALDPVESEFPIEARNYPFFFNSSPAYYVRIVKQYVSQVVEDVPIPNPNPSSSTRNASGQAPPTRRRVTTNIVGSPVYTPVSPGAPANTAMTDENVISQYRMIYYYFDHIAINEAKPREYLAWATALNGQ